MSRQWKKMYAEVRQSAPDLYNQAVASATTVGHNHNLCQKAISDIEFRMMALVHASLKLDIIKPRLDTFRTVDK